jgi:outer membrane protein OmpA-like peptidoglycan-associated protein
MVTLQNFSKEVQDFIQQHELIQHKQFAGEQPGQLQVASKQTIALLIPSLAALAGQPGGREAVWDTAREATTSHTLKTGQGTAALASQKGADLIKSVLSDRYHGTVNAIAKSAGVKTASVSQLLDIASIAAFNLLGTLTAENQWSAQQLEDWLRPNRVAAIAAEPLGAPVPNGLVGTPVHAGSPTTWLSSRTNLFLVAVSLIAVAELGYIVATRSTSTNAETVAAIDGDKLVEGTNSSTSQYTAIPVANILPTKASPKAAVPVVLKLKDGLRQVIGASSTESKLYQFLIDPGQEVDPVDPTKGWIGFDRIYFETNKATLTNESLWQLSNVASILKRFPVAKIKIGGYTDSTGNPINNLRLSKARAEAAKSSLVSLGVPADHLTAVGYGALDNITTNKTEEGRSLNRRVSLQVTEK